MLEIKQAAVGVTLDTFTVDKLLYVDDIVLLAETESDLKNLMNVVYSWCRKWTFKIKIKLNLCITGRKERHSST